MYSAVVDDGNVVWSQSYSDYPTWEYDLYGGSLQTECGDRGYSFADLNHDCLVKFEDFAIFAAKWLDCTLPEDENCTDGDVFSAAGEL
jgi:hypothetical protein